jgi:hypothetical protein
LDLGGIIGNSLEYAKKLFSDIGRLIILIVLDIIPIVNLIVVGYFAKVVRESPSSKEVPKVEGYGQMFVQGLKLAVVGILYMIIPMILILSGVAFAAMPGYGYGYGFWSMGPLGIGLAIVGVVAAFFIAIVAAIGIVHMIKQNSFGKAFAFREIVKIIGRIGWGKYLAWIIVVFVLALIVGGIAAIPAVGWIISLIISPIFGVFVARSAALVYNEGVPGVTYPPPPTTYGPPAPTMTSGMYCKFCGAAIPTDSSFCQNCGQEIK